MRSLIASGGRFSKQARSSGRSRGSELVFERQWSEIDLQPGLHPLTCFAKELGRIAVADFVVEFAQIIGCSIEVVDLSRALKNFVIAVGREIAIFASADDKKRAGRDECGDDGKIGEIGVVKINA